MTEWIRDINISQASLYVYRPVARSGFKGVPCWEKVDFFKEVDFSCKFWKKVDSFVCVFGESGLLCMVTAVAKPF